MVFNFSESLNVRNFVLFQFCLFCTNCLCLSKCLPFLHLWINWDTGTIYTLLSNRWVILYISYMFFSLQNVSLKLFNGDFSLYESCSWNMKKAISLTKTFLIGVLIFSGLWSCLSFCVIYFHICEAVFRIIMQYSKH